MRQTERFFVYYPPRARRDRYELYVPCNDAAPDFLRATGLTVDAIASYYGVAARVIEQRLKASRSARP